MDDVDKERLTTCSVNSPSTTTLQLPAPLDTSYEHNGQELGSAFHWRLVDKGIGHIYIKPNTPRLNTKVSEYVVGPHRARSGLFTAWLT
jgi:hypothetical protein